jgi:hypothetical protein
MSVAVRVIRRMVGLGGGTVMQGGVNVRVPGRVADRLG